MDSLIPTLKMSEEETEEIELKEDSVEKAEPIYSNINDTSNYNYTLVPQSPDFDKTTKYTLNERGEVIQKEETLKDRGQIHFGTGSKGEIKAKGIDIQNTGIEELQMVVHRVAYLQALMSKLREKYGEMSAERLWHLKELIPDKPEEEE